jgi:hypothetical protein
MIDIMLDLETLGTGSNATIASIGAVQFDRYTDAIVSEFYSCIDFTKTKQGEIDGSTIDWWFQQEPAAINSLIQGERREIKLALKDFTSWCYSLEHIPYSSLTDKTYLWSMSPEFDEVILRNAYKELNIPWMFKYNVGRCVRTLAEIVFEMGFNLKNEIPFVGVKHNSLDDAKHQANIVTFCYRKLKEII